MNGHARPGAGIAVDRTLTRAAVGIALVVVSWAISWSQARPFSDHTFFPLWLGYILTIDALVAWRTGTSLITRSGWRVVWLFALSIPLWWLFELLNGIVDNWSYRQPRSYTPEVKFLLSSLAFSTVVPAVLTTAELVRSLRLDRLGSLPALPMSRPWLIGYHVVGWLMLGLTAIWPTYAFPLVWLAVIFIADPVGTAIGADSIGRYLARRDWSIVLNLALGTLMCGFFWELWNSRAVPNWTYDIPYVDWLRVFEMPILGYGGYLPFGLEVYAIYAIARRVAGLAGRTRMPEARVAATRSFDRVERAHL